MRIVIHMKNVLFSFVIWFSDKAKPVLVSYSNASISHLARDDLDSEHEQTRHQAATVRFKAASIFIF